MGQTLKRHPPEFVDPDRPARLGPYRLTATQSRLFSFSVTIIGCTVMFYAPLKAMIIGSYHDDYDQDYVKPSFFSFLQGKTNLSSSAIVYMVTQHTRFVFFYKMISIN